MDAVVGEERLDFLRFRFFLSRLEIRGFFVFRGRRNPSKRKTREIQRRRMYIVASI